MKQMVTDWHNEISSTNFPLNLCSNPPPPPHPHVDLKWRRWIRETAADAHVPFCSRDESFRRFGSGQVGRKPSEDAPTAKDSPAPVLREQHGGLRPPALFPFWGRNSSGKREPEIVDRFGQIWALLAWADDRSRPSTLLSLFLPKWVHKLAGPS